MNIVKCRGCGAPIIWIKTTSGKSMPCDSYPLHYRRTEGATSKLVTSDGEVVSCEIVPADEAEGTGYVPHWSTCPEAAAFKRGGRAHGRQ